MKHVRGTMAIMEALYRCFHILAALAAAKQTQKRA